MTRPSALAVLRLMSSNWAYFMHVNPSFVAASKAARRELRLVTATHELVMIRMKY
jgi:hypothetical protein